MDFVYDDCKLSPLFAAILKTEEEKKNEKSSKYAIVHEQTTEHLQ